MTSSSGKTAPWRTRSEHPEAGITYRRAELPERFDQALFILEDEHYDTFVKTLLNPPEPGPKLRALLRRQPVWQR